MTQLSAYLRVGQKVVVLHQLGFGPPDWISLEAPIEEVLGLITEMVRQFWNLECYSLRSCCHYSQDKSDLKSETPTSNSGKLK